MKWDNNFLTDLEDRLAENLEEAAQYLETKLKAKVSVSGSTSIPGTPPHEKMGDLKESINHTTDGKTALVGTDEEYGVHLEFGTTKMAARPWLLPTFEAEKDAIAQIITQE